ncbi:hypothetical protein SAMN05421504_102962 [Amycolatopsis xylanica]|uniref:Uncharacterized protein n=1 Tax=Amycolatopsis xylanica TaxID=589385 RepID=A0A1H3AKM9_9PSEU|nr:hypothetical protein SAMN05421504_102962 [Amycolatopsis xylanica]
MRKNAAPITRKALTLSTMALLLGAGAFLGGGTASASTTLADACSGSVSSTIGSTVAISGSSVKELVRKGANEAGTLAVGDWAANDIAKVATINVGTVPNAAGGSVDGATIGKAVRAALKATGTWGLGFDQEKTLTSVQNKVAGGCGLTVIAANYVAPSSESPRDDQPSSGGTQPGSTPGTPNFTPNGGTGGLTVPARDYGNIPVAGQPGFSLPPGDKYPTGNPVPGQAPQFGLPGAANGQGADIRNAGNAEQIAAPAGDGGVELPMLLAVILLAGVTAALVRTWVLRRVS